ncbi:MAG: glycosyltransferase family 4 protein [Peptococcaceae bacterium]|nr:glycosyltransferase family 4 protein [Peptococcaceae bacterium]
MENLDRRDIYTDLVRELAHRGINVYGVSPRQRRSGLKTELFVKGNIRSLRVKTGNITQSGFIEKGIATLTIENQYYRAINRYFHEVKFDLIMYSTPPITFERLVRRLKSRHKAKSYLILKDIFPQNAVDLGIIRKNSLLWRYFRGKEVRLYRISDMIGCMSPANVRYVRLHNPYLDEDKLEVFPNSIKPRPKAASKKDRTSLSRHGIPDDAVLFLYGGNLGKPQGVNFLINVIDEFEALDKAFLLIVGSGTEFTRIERHILTTKPRKVKLLRHLPKSEYDELLECADVGLIFLDSRFTIPNFPSRLISYMEFSMPVLAATDVNTDLRDTLVDSESGFWCESGDLDKFMEYASKLAREPELRLRMGKNGRDYLEKHYDVSSTVDIILKHI